MLCMYKFFCVGNSFKYNALIVCTKYSGGMDVKNTDIKKICI